MNDHQRTLDVKLSLAPLLSPSALLLVTALSLGCSSESSPAAVAPPPASSAAEGGAVVAKRTFVERTLFATPPDNLLSDPEFAIEVAEIGHSGFLMMRGQTFARPPVRAFSTPVGGLRRAALLLDNKATETKSADITLLGRFVGVSGPLEVSVWLSRTSATGEASDAPLAASVVISPDMNIDVATDATELHADEASRVVVDGRTWTKYVARVTDGSFERGGQLFVTTGEKGGGVLVLAPDARGMTAAKHGRLTPLALGTRRALRAVEREAARRYAALEVHMERPHRVPPPPSR